VSALQQEIRQRTPFRRRTQEALLGVLRTADILRRRVAAVIEPYGITPQQYNVLRILRGAGPEGLPTLAIGERLIEQTPGVTRLIDRLEAKGLARRLRPDEDRRQVLCRITAEGLELLERLDGPMDRMDAAALAMLGPEDVEQLIRILDRVRAEGRFTNRQTEGE
jgi:DNA-binding MarR family transcriptional regulator